MKPAPPDKRPSITMVLGPGVENGSELARLKERLDRAKPALEAALADEPPAVCRHVLGEGYPFWDGESVGYQAAELRHDSGGVVMLRWPGSDNLKGRYRLVLEVVEPTE